MLGTSAKFRGLGRVLLLPSFLQNLSTLPKNPEAQDLCGEFARYKKNKNELYRMPINLTFPSAPWLSGQSACLVNRRSRVQISVVPSLLSSFIIVIEKIPFFRVYDDFNIWPFPL